VTPRTLGLAERRRLEADIVVWAAGVNGPGFVGGLDGFGVTRRATPGRSALQTLADKRVSALGDCARFDASPPAGRCCCLARAARQQARYFARLLRHAASDELCHPSATRIGGSRFRLSDMTLWRRRALWTAARTFYLFEAAWHN